MTFEEILTQLDLFSLRKEQPTSLLLTSAAWWNDIRKVEPDSSWRSFGMHAGWKLEANYDLGNCIQIERK